LIAEVASEKGIEGLVRELTNPKSFYRPSGVPSLSADSWGYQESGQYWKGAVWPPVQCIVQEGLKACGQRKLADDLARKYLAAVLEAYKRQHTITENLSPDSAVGYGVKDFVGWGGIGPVGDLIEHVLGFNVNAPENTVEWRINRQDRHGIRNLAVGGVSATFLCDKRQSPNDPCRLAFETTGDLTLKVSVQDKTSVHHLSKGRADLVVS
jgi:hypothetical protein